MQTLLRKRVYADTRVMGFILLRRSPRVFTQTYAIAVCAPFQCDGFVYMPRKSLRICRGRGLLANDYPASMFPGQQSFKRRAKVSVNVGVL